MKNILVTRAESVSENIREALQQDFSIFFEPLFEVKKLKFLNVNSEAKALIVTSSNACEAIKDSNLDPAIKIYVISNKIGLELCEAGFLNIVNSRQKTAQSLKELIIETHDKNSPLFYFHGSKITLDFEAELSAEGFLVEKFLAYEISENQNFSQSLINFCQKNAFDKILVFSKNSGKIFYNLCLKHNLLEYFNASQILCLSAEIQQEMKNLGFKNSASFAKIPPLNKIYE
jgi:uroporphyrinogen-III synthase